MWRAGLPDPADVKRFRDARERCDLTPLAIHVNYLTNLATLDPVIREKSITSFRGELERAAIIGAEYLVLHPGSYKGQSLEAGHSGVRARPGGSGKRLSGPGLDGPAGEYGGIRVPDRQQV